MKTGMLMALCGLAVLSAGVWSVRGGPPESRIGAPADRELALLLVKLERQTRAVIAKHYGSVDETHRDWMARELILPAAVADAVFYEAVPRATNDRAWVKMVVESPRNPHNKGDATALSLFAEIRSGSDRAERLTDQAYYYGEPIKAAAGCLKCHGERRGEPDPYFPQYVKNGWREGQTVGAIVARVAPPIVGQ